MLIPIIIIAVPTNWWLYSLTTKKYLQKIDIKIMFEYFNS